MASFWDDSWEKIDPKRIAEYARSFDTEKDATIEYLHTRNVKTVCDAGCGCGIYAKKLVKNGFRVSGFDVSSHAVSIAAELLKSAGVEAELKTASILSTGYPDDCFDCVVSRDVIDHMAKKDAVAAVRELYRITRPGGLILMTLDALDREYEEEAHVVNKDGDYIFTSGKWEGMVFHPYKEQEIACLIPENAAFCVKENNGKLLVKLRKSL